MNNYFLLCSFLLFLVSTYEFKLAQADIFYSYKIFFEVSRILYHEVNTNNLPKICSNSEIINEINSYELNNSPYTNCFYCKNLEDLWNRNRPDYYIYVYLYNYDASCILPHSIIAKNNSFYTNSGVLRNILITENKNITRNDSQFNRTEYFTTLPSYTKQNRNSIHQQNTTYRNPIERNISSPWKSKNYYSKHYLHKHSNSMKVYFKTTMKSVYNNNNNPITNSMDRNTYDFKQGITSKRNIHPISSRKYNRRYNRWNDYGYGREFRYKNYWRNHISTARPWKWNQHKTFRPTHFKQGITSKRNIHPISSRRYNYRYNRWNDYGYEREFRYKNYWRNHISTARPWKWNQHKTFTPTHFKQETTSKRNIHPISSRRYNYRYNRWNDYGYEREFRYKNFWRNHISTARPWAWNQHKTFRPTHHYNKRKMTISHLNKWNRIKFNNDQYIISDQTQNKYLLSYHGKFPFFNRHDFFWLSIGFFIFGIFSLAIIAALIIKLLSYRNKMEVIIKSKKSTLDGVTNPALELDVMPPRYDDLTSNSNVIHNV